MRLLLLFVLMAQAQAQPQITKIEWNQAIVDQVREYRYPVVYTNCGYTVTNLHAYGRSYGSVTVTWASEAGKSYAVESSHSAVVERLPGNLYVGDAWQPVSLPVTAAGTTTSWTGGIQWELRFYRIRELIGHEKDCDCCFLWEWMR